MKTYSHLARQYINVGRFAVPSCRVALTFVAVCCSLYALVITCNGSNDHQAPLKLDYVRPRVRAFDQVYQLLQTSGCTGAYIDVGSNIGVQIRKLYEPWKYTGKDPNMQELAAKFGLLEEPTAEESAAGVVKGQAFWNSTSPVLPIFDDLFGKAPRCHVCAIGIEPNPRHTSRLIQLQSELRAVGVPVLWLNETAAGVSNGFATLDLSAGGGMGVNDVGMSVKSLTGSPVSTRNLENNKMRDVFVIDLAELILYVQTLLETNLKVSASHKGNRKPTMVMKLDVEGGEYELLPHLLSHEALCPLDLIFLEWHNTQTRAREQNKLLKMLKDKTSVKGCRPIVSSIDDETFLFDGQPFPASNLC